MRFWQPYPGFCFILYLYVILSEETYFWNKMGYQLKVIMPHGFTSWLHHTSHEKQFHTHITTTKAWSHPWFTDTGVLAHCGWPCGLDSTDGLYSAGNWRPRLFFLHSTSGSRVRELLEDRFIDNLEIPALSSGSVNYNHQLPFCFWITVDIQSFTDFKCTTQWFSSYAY